MSKLGLLCAIALIMAAQGLVCGEPQSEKDVKLGKDSFPFSIQN